MDTEQLVEQIIECDHRAQELWESRTKRRNQKFEDKLHRRIHKIHEIEDTLFKQLWDELSGDDLDEDFELIERENWQGQKRLVFCNGVIHLEATPKYKFKFGHLCYC